MTHAVSASERFQGATLALARSAPIKERLAEAYRDHLHGLGEDELPKEIRAQFRALGEALTRVRPASRGEDAIRATVRKLSTAEAERLAQSVVHMFCVVVRPPAPALRAVPPVSAILPRQIAKG